MAWLLDAVEPLADVPALTSDLAADAQALTVACAAGDRVSDQMGEGAGTLAEVGQQVASGLRRLGSR